MKEQELEIFFVILKDSHSLTKLKNFAESLGWTDSKLNMSSLYEFVLVFNVKRNAPPVLSVASPDSTQSWRIGKNSTILSGAVLCDYTIIEDDVVVGPKKIREFL